MTVTHDTLNTATIESN